MLRIAVLVAGLALGLGLLQGCGDDSSTGPDPALDLNLSLCSPSRGGFTLVSTNPFFPLDPGSQSLLRGEGDGEQIELVITVLNETEVVAEVTTRVVEERESIDGALVEVSRNFFAEAGDGTVCYFGEEVDIFENGQIVSHEGAWRADDPGNQPGIIMPADPRPGTTYQNESAPGIAEDEAEIVESGRTVTVPAGTFTETIRVREFNPLDGGVGFKVFAADVGLIIDSAAELVSH
jgi:hypothetical protein